MIIVFGSINADLVTSVEQHPGPGETIVGSDYLVLPGGKGANQALAACRAGSETKVIGAVGNDGFASQALKNLKFAGVVLDGVTRTEGTTGVALIVLNANGENTIVVTPGANASVKSASLTDRQFSVLVTQNEIEAGEVWKAHQNARSKGAIVVHNAAPARPIPERALPNIDHLVVNESEAVLVAQSLGFEKTDPKDAARCIQSTSKSSVVLTLGARGAFSVANSGEFEAAAINVDVVDTTGAGDAFVGAFVAALDKGKDLRSAVRRGVVAGSLACRSVGAQSSIPTAAEIESCLTH